MRRYGAGGPPQEIRLENVEQIGDRVFFRSGLAQLSHFLVTPLGRLRVRSLPSGSGRLHGGCGGVTLGFGLPADCRRPVGPHCDVGDDEDPAVYDLADLGVAEPLCAQPLAHVAGEFGAFLRVSEFRDGLDQLRLLGLA